MKVEANTQLDNEGLSVYSAMIMKVEANTEIRKYDSEN